MKKLVNLMLLCLCTTISINAQWAKKKADNGFDEPYRYGICYSQENPRIWLKLEKIQDSSVLLFLYTGYVCEERPDVDYSFKTDTGYVRIYTYGIKDSESKRVYLIYDVDRNIGNIWRQSTQLKIRVRDGVCGTDVYTFDMTGSASALSWVISDK